MLPKALKSYPKSKKSPNLVTLLSGSKLGLSCLCQTTLRWRGWGEVSRTDCQVHAENAEETKHSDDNDACKELVEVFLAQHLPLSLTHTGANSLSLFYSLRCSYVQKLRTIIIFCSSRRAFQVFSSPTKDLFIISTF